jgi:hypothetical protein
LGRDPKKVFMFVMKGLFGEEPEKQRPTEPQDVGETPSMCPNQRESITQRALKMSAIH